MGRGVWDRPGPSLDHCLQGTHQDTRVPGGREPPGAGSGGSGRALWVALEHPRESAGHSLSVRAGLASSAGSSARGRRWRAGHSRAAEAAEAASSRLFLCVLTTLRGRSTRNTGGLFPREPPSVRRQKANSEGSGRRGPAMAGTRASSEDAHVEGAGEGRTAVLLRGCCRLLMALTTCGPV